MTERPDNQDDLDEGLQPAGVENVMEGGNASAPEGNKGREDDQKSDGGSSSPSVEKFLDSATLIAVGGGGLYLVGLVYFVTYFSRLGIGRNEIIFSVPVYVSQGFLASSWLLLPVAFLVYYLFLTDEEPDHPWMLDLSMLVLFGVLFVFAASTAEIQKSWGPFLLAQNISTTANLYGSAMLFVFGLVHFFLRGSLAEAWTEIDGGRVPLSVLVIAVILSNSWMAGAVGAEEFKSGVTTATATVLLEDGAELPTHDAAVLYHVVTHEDRFYFLEIWKTEDGWHERVHIVPEWNIQRMNWTARTP